jgi:TetR/AcrR family hemagglutinin/protease transcriptional regulator
MATSRRRAARLDPETRREQLLACAIRVFADRGLGRGGHAQVAEEATVAVPTVFTYFKTRSDLLQAVLREVRRYYDAMADTYHHPGVAAPRAILDNAIAFAASVDSHPDYARILLEWSASVREEIWPLYVRQQADTVARFRATIERGQRDGSIPAHLDAEDTAGMIVGSWHVVAQMKFMRRPPDKVHRFLLALLRAAIGPEAVASALV